MTIETLFAVLFAVIAAVDLAGNALVCLVLFSGGRRTRRALNTLLGNLAVANVLFGAFVLPRHVLGHAFTHPGGTSGDFLCKFLTGGTFIWTSAAASGILLVAIAFERYFAIVLPIGNRFRLSRRRVLCVVAFAWMFAVLLSAPSIAAMQYDAQSDFCAEVWPSWYLTPTVHVVFVFVCNCVLPILSMTFLYLRIIFKLWRDAPQQAHVTQAVRVKARKRVTFMLVTVTAVHTLCWSPNYIFYLLIYVASNWTYGSTLYNLTVLIILLNSACDPFLYAWYLDGFRQRLRRLLCCCQRNRTSPLSVMRSASLKALPRLAVDRVETEQPGEERVAGSEVVISSFY